MGIKNPEELSDDVFEKLVFEYNFMRNYDRKFYLEIARQVITEAFSTKTNE